MEGTMTFISVVLAIWGILEIILFFKVWGMTNDMEKVKNKLVDETDEKKYSHLKLVDIAYQVRNLYYLDKQDEAFDSLNKYVYYQLAQMKNRYIFEDKEHNNRKYIKINYQVTYLDEYVKQMLEPVLPLYAFIGKEVPEKLSSFDLVAYKNVVDQLPDEKES